MDTWPVSNMARRSIPNPMPAVVHQCLLWYTTICVLHDWSIDIYADACQKKLVNSDVSAADKVCWLQCWWYDFQRSQRCTGIHCQRHLQKYLCWCTSCTVGIGVAQLTSDCEKETMKFLHIWSAICRNFSTEKEKDILSYWDQSGPACWP